MPNGDVLEAGLSNSDQPMKSDQRIGRRGRRHKSSAKLADTKFQELSSDMENIEVGLVRTMDSQRSDGGKLKSHYVPLMLHSLCDC